MKKMMIYLLIVSFMSLPQFALAGSACCPISKKEKVKKTKACPYTEKLSSKKETKEIVSSDEVIDSLKETEK